MPHPTLPQLELGLFRADRDRGWRKYAPQFLGRSFLLETEVTYISREAFHLEYIFEAPPSLFRRLVRLLGRLLLGRQAPHAARLPPADAGPVA